MSDGTRPMIEIDEELCDGCGVCIPSCHEGALEIRDGKARLVADHLCDGLGACLGECPRGALKVVERAAVPFVAPHAAPAPVAAPPHVAHPGGGCPGSRMRTLRSLPAGPVPASGPAARPRSEASPLAHWPVQIRLVPPQAPFLREADLLVAADCVPVATRAFHDELLPGRAVMLGCPKFDDVEDCARRFAALFATAGVRSVTVAVMEVPCCQSLQAAVLRARQAAGVAVPVEVVTVGIDGTILAKQTLA